MARFLMPVVAAALVAACANDLGPTATGSSVTGANYARLAPGVALSYAGIAQGALAIGAVHMVYDPLAPNWEIEEVRIGETAYRYELRMKRYQTGGAGEPQRVLNRRAQQLQLEQGYDRYELLEYAEGIESETLGARRVASAVVRLVSQPARSMR